VQWHVPVIPSYVGGGNWEDCGSRPTWASQWEKAGHGATLLSSQWL
jgi:hypothetical protein